VAVPRGHPLPGPPVPRDSPSPNPRRSGPALGPAQCLSAAPSRSCWTPSSGRSGAWSSPSRSCGPTAPGWSSRHRSCGSASGSSSSSPSSTALLGRSCRVRARAAAPAGPAGHGLMPSGSASARGASCRAELRLLPPPPRRCSVGRHRERGRGDGAARAGQQRPHQRAAAGERPARRCAGQAEGGCTAGRAAGEAARTPGPGGGEGCAAGGVLPPPRTPRSPCRCPTPSEERCPGCLTSTKGSGEQAAVGHGPLCHRHPRCGDGAEPGGSLTPFVSSPARPAEPSGVSARQPGRRVSRSPEAGAGSCPLPRPSRLPPPQAAQQPRQQRRRRDARPRSPGPAPRSWQPASTAALGTARAPARCLPLAPGAQARAARQSAPSHPAPHWCPPQINTRQCDQKPRAEPAATCPAPRDLACCSCAARRRVPWRHPPAGPEPPGHLASPAGRREPCDPDTRHSSPAVLCIWLTETPLPQEPATAAHPGSAKPALPLLSAAASCRPF